MTMHDKNTAGRLGRLVRVVSGQGVEMTGFHAPASPQAPLLLCLHGLSGSLDTSFVFDFLEHPGLAGCHILSVASSAHGNIALGRAGEPPAYRLGGSAYECFEDCMADLAAWMDFAAAQTAGPIVLLGHSLGACKITHYAAHADDARVRGLVLASAPDLAGAFFARYGTARVEAFLVEARRRVAQGQGRSLMGEDCVIGLLGQRVSAQTLLDRFEPGRPADTFDFHRRGSASAFQALGRVAVPVLALYGEQGEIVGPDGVPGALALLRRHAVRAPFFDEAIVPGNHWYRGVEPDAAAHVADWLARRDLMPDQKGEAA